ncbi:MAG: autotransporter domain-containing protein [Brevundimonas sp.]
MTAFANIAGTTQGTNQLRSSARSTARRGTSLLCGTALGCSLMVLAAAPGTAWASDECGVNTGQPIVCPVANYPNGISYYGSVPLDLTVAEASTTGDSASVIFINGGTGAVAIKAGLIESWGRGSAGVNVITSSGAISITSDEITTHGGFFNNYTSEGVYAQSDTGAISINANTTIVEGEYSSALVGITRNADISITSQTIHSTAPSAIALYADASQGGNVTVDSGLLTAVSQGIIARGTAAVTISSDAVEITGTTGSNYYGIFGRSTNGPVVIDSGSIVSSAPRSPGIYGLSTAGTVSVTSDTISMSGDGSIGIYANGFAGVTVDSGSISTTGSPHYLNGVWRNADAIWAVSATGPISITSDTITTSGVNARGIVVDADGVFEWSGHRGANPLNGTGLLTIDSGSIQTTGVGGVGIFVDHVGDIDITSGSISTTGNYGFGIYAYGGGDIAIDSGTVIVEGSVAPGIVARTVDGDISITSDYAQSVNDVAVYAYSNNGDISITSGHALTTLTGDPTHPDGFTADAVFAQSETGSVTIHSGLAETFSNYAWGVIGFAGTDVVVVSDQVATTGIYGVGIYANAGDVASITSNAITTLGDGAIGLRARGNDGVNIVSGSIETSGTTGYITGVARQADGIWASSATGPISITSTSIATAGAGARGIVVDANSVVPFDVPFNGFRGADAANGTGVLTIDSGSILTAGSNATGIVVDHVGAISIATDSIQTAGDFSGGVYVYGGVAGVTVDGGTITTAGQDALGIAVRTAAGNVAISASDVRTSGLGSVGIFAETVSGAVDITAGTVVTTGGFSRNTSEGILAMTGTGAINISAQSVDVSGGYASAIVAITTNADIAISSVDIHSTAEQSLTLYASASEGGSITIDSGSIQTEAQGIHARGVSGINVASGAIEVGGTGAGRFDGIDARSSGGDVAIDSGSIINASASGMGIQGFAGGSLGIASDSINLTGAARVDSGGATVVSAGIKAVAAGDISITSGTISTVGDRASGMLASSSSGDVDIDSVAIVATGIGANGIEAYAADQINIHSGSISVAGTSATGIFANGTNGVAINSASISGSGDHQRGIDVHTDALATLTVADINMTGVGASGLQVMSHDLTLNVTGDVVAAQGFGAYITTTGAAEINLAAGSSIQGGLIGLYLNSGESSVINILGEIVGLGGQALVVEGAAVTVNNNSNTIIGSIQLTDGADTFNNNGTWVASGTSDFGAGNDVIVNNGLFNATATGGVTILGLEAFSNNGQMDLRNGVLGDSVDLGGASYVGGTGSQLMVDVDFATGESDSLIVGSAAGTTEIIVNNLATTPGFSAGLSFIDSATPLSGTEFTLDPDSIGNGFVDFNLVFDPLTNSYAIQALPSSDAVSMLRAGTAAQDYASKSGEAWSGRLEDLRDSQWAGLNRRGAVEAWGQILFGQNDMDQVGDFDLLGTTVTRDLSSESQWSGIQIGIDRAMTMGGGQVVIGFTGGFMDYEMDFSADDNRFKLDGYNLGVYGAFTSGPLTLSTLAKVDRFDSTADLRELGDSADFEGSSFDVQAEAAYRFGSATMFVEPVVAVDWIKADLDTLVVAGATAEFEDATSLRARVGARAGGITRVGAVTLVPFVGAYAIEELRGENRMNFTLGATSVNFVDQPYGTHGRADIGVTMVGPHGFNAWAKAEADFGDGAEGVTLRLGARWNW